MRVGLAAALACWAGVATPCIAQSPAVAPGEELTVTLITYEPGGRLFERYGHNAVWIHDTKTGEDEHYDYGRFSFRQKHFLLRFIQGRNWYSMGFEQNVQGVVDAYIRDGRRVWMQELNLAPAERLKLREFLAWNYRPENRDYAYDEYRDNCSTRIRDALDRVMGGAIGRFGDSASGWTWRDETRRLNQHSVGLYTGLLIVLGEPTDRVMSRWEQMFLPMRLREALNHVTITGPDGVARPAVRTERLVAPGGRWPIPERPSNWLPGYLAVGLALGGILLLARRTWAFMALATLWMLLVGLVGTLALALWVLTFHREAYANENLLQLNLIALALAVVLPAAWRGSSWAMRPGRFLAALVVGLSVLGLLIKPLPWFGQHNLEVIALVLPGHLAVWAGLRSRGLAAPR